MSDYLTFSLFCRMKDLAIGLEKQQQLLKLVIQKMEIRSEADERDVGASVSNLIIWSCYVKLVIWSCFVKLFCEAAYMKLFQKAVKWSCFWNWSYEAILWSCMYVLKAVSSQLESILVLSLISICRMVGRPPLSEMSNDWCRPHGVYRIYTL